MNEFPLKAKLENLDIILDALQDHLVDCPEKIKHQVSIAVDEIFSNICHYAYNPDVGDVVVRIKIDEDITLEFEDSGKPYNPLDLETPDLTSKVEDRKIGGLGIYMVKNLMDYVHYQRIDNKNILTIKKKLEVRSEK